MTKKIIIDERTVLPDDMTQEDLDEMMGMLQKMIDEGTLEENSREVTPEELEDLGIDVGDLFKRDIPIH